MRSYFLPVIWNSVHWNIKELTPVCATFISETNIAVGSYRGILATEYELHVLLTV
jgi:hypothetical protein